MTPSALFRDLHQRGLSLTSDGFNLFISPRHLIAPEIRCAVKSSKDGLMVLVELYEERAAIMQFGGGMSKDEAERMALDDITNRY